MIPNWVKWVAAVIVVAYVLNINIPVVLTSVVHSVQQMHYQSGGH